MSFKLAASKIKIKMILILIRKGPRPGQAVLIKLYLSVTTNKPPSTKFRIYYLTHQDVIYQNLAEKTWMWFLLKL